MTSKEEALPGWLSSTLSIKEFENRIKSNDFTNLVYEKNNSIIGYISIKNKQHIYHLFVSEEQQRKGIAKELWEKAKKLCLRKKYTVRSSLYALPVYEYFGFKKIGKVEMKDNIQFQEMELILTC